MPLHHTFRRATYALAALLSVAALVLLVPIGPVGAQSESQDATRPADALLPDERNTVDIVDTYGPAVVAVNVSVEGRITSPFEDIPEDQIPPFFREFMPEFEERQAPRRGSGSGFVVDADGGVVTNYHVVAQALQDGSVDLREGAELTVSFPDGSTHPATVQGANALYDLALLQLEDPSALPETLRPIELGNGEAPMVGQKAIAIGNPFGFESTVTTGIVSGIGRSLPGVGEVNVPLVQTDAAINPGNSGGPLLDSSGDLIGVNTAIIPSLGAGGQRGSLGIGFAVPSSTLSSVLDDLRDGGFTSIDTRPRLGIQIRDVSAYPDAIRERLGIPDEGVGVLQVQPGSAAEEAGLRGSEFAVQIGGQTVPVPGDVITAADGDPITSADQLQRHVFARSEGDVVTLSVLRGDETLEIDVELAVVPTETEEE
ncbi:MAG: trypsin-like peptidase domain-containing protein [Trueperaceae bacterium]|nr:trypsin-like peptidase domain-containing protein [Trueperaceae bacterium]